MGITVLKHNAPWGPFTREQIEAGLQRGDFTLHYLAHAPGLKEWLPLGEVLHLVETRASLPPVPPALPSIPSREAREKAPPPPLPVPPPLLPQAKAPARPPALPLVSAPPEVKLDAAPFFSRGLAFLIDCGVLFVPILLLFALGAVTIEVQGWWEKTDAETMRQEWTLLNRNFHDLLLLVAFGLAWPYAAGLECSPWQATVGKRWMGLRVTDAQGERLGFLRSSGRHAGKYLSALPFFLGFIMALFSSRGLALHDRLAATRVIRQEAKR